MFTDTLKGGETIEFSAIPVKENYFLPKNLFLICIKTEIWKNLLVRQIWKHYFCKIFKFFYGSLFSLFYWHIFLVHFYWYILLTCYFTEIFKFGIKFDTYSNWKKINFKYKNLIKFDILHFSSNFFFFVYAPYFYKIRKI